MRLSPLLRSGDKLRIRRNKTLSHSYRNILFCDFCALLYLSKKTCLKNFENAKSHVKFSEELESSIRIWLRVLALPKNCQK